MRQKQHLTRHAAQLLLPQAPRGFSLPLTALSVFLPSSTAWMIWTAMICLSEEGVPGVETGDGDGPLSCRLQPPGAEVAACWLPHPFFLLHFRLASLKHTFPTPRALVGGGLAGCAPSPS